MASDDGTIHCRPTAGERAAVGVCAALISAVGALLWVLPTGRSEFDQLGGLALGAGAVVGSIAWLGRTFLRRRGADAWGLSWRDALGRDRRVPWAAIAEVRRVLPPGATPDHAVYVATLADGRTISWGVAWDRAEALFRRVDASFDRGAYRSRGDRTDGPLHTFNDGRVARWVDIGWLALVSAFPLALLACLGATALHLVHTHGDLGPPLAFVSLMLPCLVFFPLAALWGAARLLWVVPSRDVFALDDGGVRVQRDGQLLVARWGDVLSVTPERIKGVPRFRVETRTFTLTLGPETYHAASIMLLVRERIPGSVREAWDLASEALCGDVPTRTARGTTRHRLSFTNVGPWVIDAVGALLIGFRLVVEVTMQPDDAPLHVATGRLAVLAGAFAAWVLVHRAARALCYIDVSSEGCVWNGLRHRRRFAWSEVTALSLPGRDRPLAITLCDGTRLQHLSDVVAGRAHLVRTLRERLPDLVT